MAANSFIHLTNQARKNIVSLAEEDYADALETIKTANLEKYHYAGEDDAATRHLGLAVDDTTLGFLNPEKTGVDLYELASLILAGTKGLISRADAQQAQIDELREKLGEISLKSEVKEAEGGSLFSLTSIFDYLLSRLEAIGLSLKNNLFETKEIVVENIKIKQAENEDERMTGQGTIPAYATSTVVMNKNITLDSKIFITWLNKLNKIEWWICEKNTAESFRICLDPATEMEIKFDYWILGMSEEELPPDVANEAVPADNQSLTPASGAIKDSAPVKEESGLLETGAEENIIGLDENGSQGSQPDNNETPGNLEVPEENISSAPFVFFGEEGIPEEPNEDLKVEESIENAENNEEISDSPAKEDAPSSLNEDETSFIE